jgi:phospholipid transport system substrate-binding protein
MRPIFARLVPLVVALALAVPAHAQSDSPQEAIRSLNEALLESMRNADELGFDGRFELLSPVLRDVFDFRTMTRYSVGPTNWSSLSAEQQDTLVDAFSRMSVATFAGRFDSYSGQDFRVLGQQPAPRDTMLVRTQLVRPNGDPVRLDYVMREASEGWKAVDVFLDRTVSELARLRSEYSAVFDREGYDGLIEAIEAGIERQREG